MEDQVKAFYITRDPVVVIHLEGSKQAINDYAEKFFEMFSDHKPVFKWKEDGNALIMRERRAVSTLG